MSNTPHWFPMVSRVAASLVGGYTIVWGFTTLLIALSLMAGSEYGDARKLAFLVFLGVFLWAFAAKRLTVVWVVLAGGGAAMTGAAWLLTRSLA